MSKVDLTYRCCAQSGHRRMVAFEPMLEGAGWIRGKASGAMPDVVVDGELVCETCSSGDCGGPC